MTDPAWTAQLDQLAASARDIAKAVAAHYYAPIDEGIPEHVAVPLTIGWIHAARIDE